MKFNNITDLIKKCKDNEEEFINTEDLKNIYSFLDVYIEKKHYAFECRKAKKKIDKLDHENPASLKFGNIVETLTDLKNNMEKNILKYDSTFSVEEYQQKNKEMYKIGKNENEKDKFLGNFSFDSIEILFDEMDLFEPVFNITYWNGLKEKLITKENITRKELITELENTNCFLNTNKIEKVINYFINIGKKQEQIIISEKVFKKGFYLKNNKIIKNIDLEIKEYNKDNLKKAITILNEVMSSRSEEGKKNDSTVYRYMLYSPFNYCLKQLGYGDANYSLILIGASQTNKSGAIKIANHFYNNTDEETAGSTVSVLGSKLEENSFPKVFDECDHLFKLKEANNVMKRAVYEKTARATKDRNDNKKIDEFQALALPVFLLNEPQEFKDFITNRYKIIRYTNNSFIPDSKKKQFNTKYMPKSPNTILKILGIIGLAYAKRMIKIIEDFKQHNKLFQPEETTIEILYEISEETGVEFIKEMYEPTKPSDYYNYDINEEIRKLLNSEFKYKNRLRFNSTYNSNMFINSIVNRDFPFVYYNRYRTQRTIDRHFIIDSSKFVKYINKQLQEHVDLETILKALNLTEILKKRAKQNNKEYEDYIKTQIKFKSNEGKTMNVTGFYLTTDELMLNLFSIDVEIKNNEN